MHADIPIDPELSLSNILISLRAMRPPRGRPASKRQPHMNAVCNDDGSDDGTSDCKRGELVGGDLAGSVLVNRVEPSTQRLHLLRVNLVVILAALLLRRN